MARIQTEIPQSSPVALESVENILSSVASSITGAGKRIAFYSHDTLGLGHLRRTLKIARGVTSLYPEISALIISGSPDVGLVTNQLSHSGSSSAKIDVVKLPSVRKVDNEEYAARFLPDDIERIVAIRSEIILGIVKTFEPHMLLVDHAPVGMRGELLPTFEWLNQERGSSKLVYGMREIIDDPATIRNRWEEKKVYDVLRDTYDAILIYGDPRLVPTAEHYALDESTLAKTHYCGYVGDSEWRSKSQRSERIASTTDKKLVVVTIGGGDYYGPEIIGAYLKMIRKNKAWVDFDSVLITGPLLKPELFREYEAEAKDLPVTLHSSVDRIPDVLCASDLLITTAGYNSAVDALSYAKRTLMAPRMSMRKEQIIRAESLGEVGAVEVFDPHQTSSEELFEKVTRMLNQEEAPLAKIRDAGGIDLDGSLRAAAICGQVMELTS